MRREPALTLGNQQDQDVLSVSICDTHNVEVCGSVLILGYAAEPELVIAAWKSRSAFREDHGIGTAGATARVVIS